jgi:bifunctional DNA-binding transcriptional regulator/antitoxin component of YhaV-PrlF toxin-antitoxin module
MVDEACGILSAQNEIDKKGFPVTAKLPDELRRVVSAHPGEPLELIDEQTHAAYMLVPADEFQRLKSAAEDELGDTYAAQVESAVQAGWNDPRMDEYNDYDAHRGQP